MDYGLIDWQIAIGDAKVAASALDVALGRLGDSGREADPWNLLHAIGWENHRSARSYQDRESTDASACEATDRHGEKTG